MLVVYIGYDMSLYIIWSFMEVMQGTVIKQAFGKLLKTSRTRFIELYITWQQLSHVENTNTESFISMWNSA